MRCHRNKESNCRIVFLENDRGDTMVGYDDSVGDGTSEQGRPKLLAGMNGAEDNRSQS